MVSARRAAHPPRHVTVVSDNRETLDRLGAYLRRAGVATNGTKNVRQLAWMTPPASAVIVLFPDDFGASSVMSALATLRSQRPKTRLVLVTKDPKRFASLPPAEGGAAPLILPKPVWGWMLLDALRARLDADAPEGGASR